MRRLRGCPPPLCVRVGLVVALVTCCAAAEPTDDKEVSGKPGALKDDSRAPNALSEEEREEARLLYERGKEEYARGDYDRALEQFSEVYRRTGHPALLFNMAQAHRLSGEGHCTAASRLYDAYLKEDPEAPNRSEVIERLAALRPCVERESARSAAAQADPAERARPTAPVAAKVLALGGAVLLATGAGLLTASKVRYRDAESECPCEPGAFDDWETLEKVSVGLLVGGGATGLSGATWWWLSTRDRSPASSEEFGAPAEQHGAPTAARASRSFIGGLGISF